MKRNYPSPFLSLQRARNRRAVRDHFGPLPVANPIQPCPAAASQRRAALSSEPEPLKVYHFPPRGLATLFLLHKNAGDVFSMALRPRSSTAPIRPSPSCSFARYRNGTAAATAEPLATREQSFGENPALTV